MLYRVLITIALLGMTFQAHAEPKRRDLKSGKSLEFGTVHDVAPTTATGRFEALSQKNEEGIVKEQGGIKKEILPLTKDSTLMKLFKNQVEICAAKMLEGSHTLLSADRSKENTGNQFQDDAAKKCAAEVAGQLASQLTQSGFSCTKNLERKDLDSSNLDSSK